MSSKKLLEENHELIVEILNENEDIKISEIARELIKRLELDIDPSKYDSFRRLVSYYISINELRPKATDTDKQLLINKISQMVPMDSERIKRSDIFQTDIENEFVEPQGDEVEIDDQIEDLNLNAHENAKDYRYISDDDEYIFTNMRGRVLTFTGTMIREMKKAYSNESGSPMTMNEISREFKIPRWVFHNIKTALAWTHDSEMFTDEEFALANEESDINSLVEDALSERKFSYFQKLTRAEQKMILKAANDWWAFKGLKLNPFLEAYKPQTIEVPRLESIAEGDDKYALVISPFDLHYGKYGWENEVGVSYDRKTARDLLMSKTKALIPDIRKFNVEKIIIPVGSDFFHVDTMRGTTTKGTPQDCDGTYTQIMVEGNQLMLDFINMMRQIADIEIILTAGNHDFKLSHSLLEFLFAHFRNNDDVVVKRAHHFRQYTRYGNTLIGVTHGDSTKLKDLPNCMAREAKQDWAECEHYAYFHGHLHHEVVRDVQGIKLYQMPSLSGSDRWHHNHNYEGSVRGLAAYLVHETKGVRINILENV